jgi:hypothetical protein
MVTLSREIERIPSLMIASPGRAFSVKTVMVMSP